MHLTCPPAQRSAHATHLMGDDHQISLFGACLFNTYVPCVPSPTVSTPDCGAGRGRVSAACGNWLAHPTTHGVAEVHVIPQHFIQGLQVLLQCVDPLVRKVVELWLAQLATGPAQSVQLRLCCTLLTHSGAKSMPYWVEQACAPTRRATVGKCSGTATAKAWAFRARAPSTGRRRNNRWLAKAAHAMVQSRLLGQLRHSEH